MAINQRAQDLHALQPDPLEPRAEEVERYVAALQEIAESDPDLAVGLSLGLPLAQRKILASAPWALACLNASCQYTYQGER